MFVFPMVGLSSRFFREGYNLPKYQLPLHGETVFFHVVQSFRKYFSTDEFRFLCRHDFGAAEFVKAELAKLGVERSSIQTFDVDTRGQAETVYLGIRDVAPDSELYIFNVDTFRPDFTKADFAAPVDGYLEVFEAEGEHWSFVQPGEHNSVVATTEKVKVSDLCSDGLYYFRHKGDFDRAFELAVASEATCKGEYYVAPLYNRLIADGANIKFKEIPAEEVILCGTPAEYESCRSR